MEMINAKDARHEYIMRRWGLAIDRLRQAKTSADKERATGWCIIWGMAIGT